MSAAFLALCGLALLFAADVVLPALLPGFRAADAWLGQMLAAGWLAMAVLNWFNQLTLLGGIYGRAVVMSNVAFYFIAAMVLVRTLLTRTAPTALWIVAIPMFILAAVYFWLLLRGPVESDIARHRGE